MKKIAFIGLGILILIAALYALGPTPTKPVLNPEPLKTNTPINLIEAKITKAESGFSTLKPENQAEIVWLNIPDSVTEYSVVYLHGFSASKREGNPVHKAFATRYGCNLYLPRLYGHGLASKEPLLDLTPENYLQSALEAVSVGKTIGKKVILLCTSTGGTLGLFLAAHDPDIAAVICYSPNIDFYDTNSRFLVGPWGLQIGRMLMGGNYYEFEASEQFKKYWQTKYRIEGLVALRMLVDETMTEETFSKIHQPVFIGGYYKDEENQDKVVSIKAMKRAISQIGTDKANKRFVAFSTVGAHVMTNPMRSTDIDTVLSETYIFAEQILGLKACKSRPLKNAIK